MLEKQSPEESPYQHRKSAYRAPTSNDRPQQVYIFGRPMDRAIDLFRENGAADCAC